MKTRHYARVGGAFLQCILLCILLSIVAAACNEESSSEEKDNSPEESVRPVKVDTLRRSDIDSVLRYVGDLKPYVVVKVYSPMPDRILSFPWKDGDEITAGEQVAFIRRAGLDKGLEQLLAQVEALDIQVKNLEEELERSSELLEAGVITKQVFDQMQTSYLATKAQLRAAEASKGQLAVSAADAVVRAPIDGVIAGKALEVGDMALPQVPLCQIMSIDRLKMEVRLIERDVSRVKLGQDVGLKLDAFPGRSFSGTLTRIVPYLDPQTRTNTAEVTLDNPRDESGHRLLKPGMYGMAELVVDRREQVLTAPETALLLDNRILAQQLPGETLRKAFVVDAQSIAHQRLVKLGARKGSIYEILEGLNDNDRIVVRGQHGLKEGEKVRIVGAE